MIGPPGAGKSLMGKALQAAHPNQVVEFLSVGEQLRAEGLVDAYMVCPSPVNRARMRTRARELLEASCSALAAADDGKTRQPK